MKSTNKFNGSNIVRLIIAIMILSHYDSLIDEITLVPSFMDMNLIDYFYTWDYIEGTYSVKIGSINIFINLNEKYLLDLCDCISLYAKDKTSYNINNLPIFIFPYFFNLQSQESHTFTDNLDGKIFESSGSVNGRGFANTRYFVELSKESNLYSQEHGSGEFSSNENIELLSISINNDTLKKSEDIETDKYIYDSQGTLTLKDDNFSSLYDEMSLRLPGDNIINFADRWSNVIKATSAETGQIMQESITSANRINKSGKLVVEEGGLDAKSNSDFKGISDFKYKSSTGGHIQSYSGDFIVDNDFSSDEYSTCVDGIGFADINNKVEKDGKLKSYVKGSGKICLEEKIASEDSYINKSISTKYGPSTFYINDNRALIRSAKWAEGVSSEVSSIGLISESFSDLYWLEKATEISDHTQVKSHAAFLGRAEYYVNDKNISNLEQYIGNYNINRNISIKVLPRYNKAHITVRKEPYIDTEDRGRIIYIIIVENDGNRLLGPIYVKDIFPTGTVFLDSSLMPIELTRRYANWSISELPNGKSTSIQLTLRISGRIDNLINRVKATAYYIDAKGRERKTVSNYNSTVTYDSSKWSSNDSDFQLSMKAMQDTANPKNITYRIVVDNKAAYNATMNLTAQLSEDTKYLEVSPKPKNINESYISWSFNLSAGKTRMPNYKVEASKTGIFTSRAVLRAFSLTGELLSTQKTDASALVINESHDLYTTRTIDDWLQGDLSDPATTLSGSNCGCVWNMSGSAYSTQPLIKFVAPEQGYDEELSCC